MRVKVTLNNVGLVIPCGESTDRVERLLLDIGSRFENHGIKTGELRIAQLQTSDGFQIHPKEYIKDVIRDNEVLIALDYDEYMQIQEKFCKTIWLSVVESDYKDSESKWIQVGLHEHNKLFVKFGTGYPSGKNAKLLRLELFDVDSLQHFAKEGRVLIGSKSDNDGNWKIEAHFLIEKGTAQAVEVVVKTSSMFQAVIKKVGIQISGKKLSQGEVSSVQSEISFVDTSNQIALPADSQSGPSFPENEPEPPKVENNHVASGDVPLQITQKEKVYADQSWVRDGKFTNFFYSEFEVVNASNAEVALTKITSAYQNANGEWVEVNTRSGYKNGFFNYSWNANGKFNLKSLEQDSIAVCSEIVVTSPQFERLRRAHSSLPQPLKLKISFHDIHGKVSSVIVEQVNGPRDIYTKKSKEDYDKKPIDQWVQCDDTNMEARLWGLLRKENDNYGDYLIVQVAPNTYSSLRTTHYGEYIWDAVQKNTNEVDIGSLYENNGCTGKSSLLIDLEKKKVYGIKIELKTTTSHVVKHFRIPELACC